MATIINGDTGVSQVQQTISAAITLTATKSGAKFYVAAATVAYNITLPAAGAGLNFEFEGINGAYAVGLTYAGTLYLPDGTTAAAGTFSQINLGVIGNTIKIRSDGTNWFMSTLGQTIVKPALATNQAVNFSQVIGLGQTWQNVTASRLSGTNYTNTTGKPIQISFWGTSPAGELLSIRIYVNSINTSYVYNQPVSGVSTVGTVAAIVPNGGVYYITHNSTTSQEWTELR